eukprot:COSAG05_NODE_1404_length_4970_cov_15292.071649_4_plen_67_part_00
MLPPLLLRLFDTYLAILIWSSSHIWPIFPRVNHARIVHESTIYKAHWDISVSKMRCASHHLIASGV